MDLLELMKKRRSIRKYKGTPVMEEQLSRVLEAGRLAPSARNMQEWKFVVVRGGLLEPLTEACCGQAMVKEAGAAVAVCAVEDHMMGCGQSSATVDCSIALSFMLLEAEELGLGMCWLGSFDAPAVKRVLELPEGWTVVAVSPLGVPAESPDPRPRKPIGELAVYLGE